MELVNGLYNIDNKQFADPYGNGIERFDNLLKYVQRALKGLGDNTVSAIEVAKALYHIKALELYKGYPVPGSKGMSVFQDFNSFCAEIFKAKKSTIYNYLALYERFGASGGLSRELPPNFNVSDYTYTQLILMVNMSDAELLEVKPDWTCSKIKDYVKAKKEKEEFSNRLENCDAEALEDVPAEAYESFLLNNDERRKEFLTTFKRWNKCAEAVILDEKIMIYEIALSVSAKLYAVQSCVNNYERVRLCLFDPSASRHDCFIYDLHSTFSIFSISRECYIVNFLRDRKIKSIDIAKE